MKRKRLMAGMFGAALFISQTGCTIGIRDAFSAGVYDFVTATVTETLTVFNPLSLLTAVINSTTAASE